MDYQIVIKYTSDSDQISQSILKVLDNYLPYLADNVKVTISEVVA